LGQGSAYDVLERLAVALAEGPPLRLPMVGEHHQAIGTRRLRGRALEPGQLPVVAVQHRQGIGRADPRMMGHLVVAYEGRVGDRYPLHDVCHQECRDEVAHHTAIAARIRGYTPFLSTCSAPARRWREAARRSLAMSARDRTIVRMNP